MSTLVSWVGYTWFSDSATFQNAMGNFGDGAQLKRNGSIVAYRSVNYYHVRCQKQDYVKIMQDTGSLIKLVISPL